MILNCAGRLAGGASYAPGGSLLASWGQAAKMRGKRWPGASGLGASEGGGGGVDGKVRCIVNLCLTLRAMGGVAATCTTQWVIS